LTATAVQEARHDRLRHNIDYILKSIHVFSTQPTPKRRTVFLPNYFRHTRKVYVFSEEDFRKLILLLRFLLNRLDRN